MASYRAFGLTLDSEIPLPGLHPAAAGPPDVALRLVEPGALDAVWSGATDKPVWETRFPDGHDVRAELGRAGDQLLAYGENARFHLSADLATISCAIEDERDPHWLRFLLDTVLWWLCLSRGRQVIHASAVATQAGVLAFASATGGGKTTLAAEFLRRGHDLFSDDVLVLEHVAGQAPVAHPGPALMNLPWAAGLTQELGRRLASFDEQREDWVVVDSSSSDSAPVAALFLLRRAPGLASAVERRDVTVLDVLPHLWGLPHSAETPHERFHAAGDLADSIPIYDLTSDPAVTPAALADLVERATLPAGLDPILEGSLAR